MKFGKRAARSGAKRSLVLVVSVLVLLLAVAGGTLAWLTAQDSVANTFTAAHVSCKVTEDFNGTTKSNVNVENTGDIPAYIRVRLVTYRVNDNGDHIGGTATIPEFTLGTNWVKNGEYYYYTLPVAAGGKPATNLTNSMTLTGSYNDADGGKQVIEVMAEAIQSVPTSTVIDVWGPVTSVASDGTLTVN